MSIARLDGLFILLVDDEQTLREVLCSTLRAHGAKVIDAPNGVVAMQLIQSNRLDLVISDIRMPGGDGIGLLTQIKELKGHQPKVILITGHADIGADDALRKGAVALLPKPFGGEKLVTTILETI